MAEYMTIEVHLGSGDNYDGKMGRGNKKVKENVRYICS